MVGLAHRGRGGLCEAAPGVDLLRNIPPSPGSPRELLRFPFDASCGPSPVLFSRRQARGNSCSPLHCTFDASRWMPSVRTRSRLTFCPREADAALRAEAGPRRGAGDARVQQPPRICAAGELASPRPHAPAAPVLTTDLASDGKRGCKLPSQWMVPARRPSRCRWPSARRERVRRERPDPSA